MDTVISHPNSYVLGIVLKTEKELVLEKESTMKISVKKKGVCGTREREREREVYLATTTKYPSDARSLTSTHRRPTVH